jgi:hypothetical protein
MDTVIVVALFALWLLFSIAAISSLVSAARMPQARWHAVQRNKAVTIVLILVTGGFGGLLYWLRIRPELMAVDPNARPPELTKSQRRAVDAYRSII